MQGFDRSSFFQDLRNRELNGLRVRKRYYTDSLSPDSGSPCAGILNVEHDGATSPPLAVSFGKIDRSNHILAVSDEDGYISFYDTRRKLSSVAYGLETSAKARVSFWVAHQNAVFDICWNKDDAQILTASGDQTIKIWNVERSKCLGALVGHTGSIKSVCSHPSNSDLVVSGSRDGSFALWDLRCKSSSRSRPGEVCLSLTAAVNGAHAPTRGKRVRRGKVANMSITAVLYLKDEISVATAGAADSVVKFWDTRHLKNHYAQTHPCSEVSTEKERRQHGISSLSQDSNGVFIAASCMNNRIYLYDILRLDKAPPKIFSGSRLESFYVKSAISPDATQLLSGSSDGNAYLWQVDKPDADPIALKGHEGEVTTVDWCLSEAGKIATSSDDFMVRIWNIENCRFWANTKSPPSSVRRRVTAISDEQRNLVLKELETEVRDTSSCHTENPVGQQSPAGSVGFEVRTPEPWKKRAYSLFPEDVSSELQKTPESAMKSPSSVLNPPPSLKRRTIRDYFEAIS
ncbi:hypothetical protein H6P81_009745 [Aristolochia fimbriata]|uniref:Denticleless n=1 Tax=Aristolochia fimbriata TaxID=158543 RepID=A0AAV7ELV2_ARIFI|nr:hypothetical protein H6P81_009745 [Aristolochia fimbriata]